MNMMQDDGEKPSKGSEGQTRDSTADGGKSGGIAQRADGIRLSFFADHCSFLTGVLPNIRIRLFKALGIDTDNKNSSIRWEQFVELYCICELGQLEKESLIRFWSKVRFYKGRVSNNFRCA